MHRKFDTIVILYRASENFRMGKISEWKIIHQFLPVTCSFRVSFKPHTVVCHIEHFHMKIVHDKIVSSSDKNFLIKSSRSGY